MKAALCAGIVLLMLLLLSGVAGDARAAGGCAPGSDPDADAVCTSSDNCPTWPNPDQQDSDGDGRGDLCQCGDADADGDFDPDDTQLLSATVAVGGIQKPEGSLPLLCDVDGNGRCDANDLRLMQLAQAGLLELPSALCAEHGLVVEKVLNRIGYGGDDWSRARVEALGLEGYVQEQLDPGGIADPDFNARLSSYQTAPFATWGKSIPLLESQFCDAGNPLCTNRISGPNVIVAQLAEIKLLRAIYSRRQLEAVLLDFWVNHFNVDGTNRIARWAMPEYEQSNIRPNLFGKFEDLVQGMAEGLAMLDYLDQRRSRATNTNENFARELMELHTSGTAAYDEEDVQEVTRILTGYTYDSDRVFEYKSNLHDSGTKTVTFAGSPAWTFDGTQGCGSTPAGAFANEGEVLICLLARHPLTAVRISRKLIQRFVTEAPSNAFVSQVVQVWLQTDGDLSQVLEAILLSPEFLGLRYFREKAKRPHHAVASMVRAVSKGTEGTSRILGAYSESRRQDSFSGLIGDLELMGERLYAAGPPTGYPEASPAWVTAGGLLLRMNASEKIVSALSDPAATFEINTPSTSEIIEQVEKKLMPSRLAFTTRARMRLLLDGLLASESDEDRVRQAAIVALSAPEFLLY